MTSTDVTQLVIAAALVLLAGLLASAEAALSSLSKAHVHELVRESRRGAGRLETILADTPRYVNTTLLLRVLCETTATVLVTLVFVDLVEPTWVQVLTAAGTMLVVSYIVVGVGPRTVGRQHADRVAILMARPVQALTAVLGPIPQLLIFIGNALTPGRGFREGPFATEAELRELVDLAEQSRLIESDESKMIHSVFELGDTLVREVMVPRTDMVFIERYKRLRQMMSLALRSGFSRIPVIGEDLDDIIGIAYLKDVTKRVFDRHEAESTERVDSVMRPVLFVPDSKPAADLMREMQAKRMHVAVVVDEYGGTAGVITLQDVFEEVVGKVEEGGSAPGNLYVDPAGRLRAPGTARLDEVAERLALTLAHEDVDSVSGVILALLGRPPVAGDTVTYDRMRFVVTAVRGHGVQQARARLLPAATTLDE
jgi:CBS domain containing-hemolysin-like protein